MKFSVELQRKQAIGQLLLEDIYIFPMVITFLIMYNKNHFFYNSHVNHKNMNLLPKNKYKKTLLTYNESLSKNWSWTYSSAYSALLTREVSTDHSDTEIVFDHYN